MQIETDYLELCHFTGEPWYYDTLRAAITQHIQDNYNRYKILL